MTNNSGRIFRLLLASAGASVAAIGINSAHLCSATVSDISSMVSGQASSLSSNPNFAGTIFAKFSEILLSVIVFVLSFIACSAMGSASVARK